MGGGAAAEGDPLDLRQTRQLPTNAQPNLSRTEAAERGGVGQAEIGLQTTIRRNIKGGMISKRSVRLDILRNFKLRRGLSLRNVLGGYAEGREKTNNRKKETDQTTQQHKTSPRKT